MPELKSGFVGSVEIWSDGDVLVELESGDEDYLWFRDGTRISKGELIVYAPTTQRVRGVSPTPPRFYHKLITKEEFEASMNST